MTRSWSYSEFSSALKCMRLFKYLYIDRLKTNALEGADLAFGTAVHSAINAVLEGDDGTVVFETIWNDAARQELAYGRFKHDDLMNIGLRFIDLFTRREAKHYTPHVMEQRLYGEYKGIKLEGTLDFSGTHKGVKVVADWKTSGYPYAKEKADVALQLYLYTYLAKTQLDFHPEKIMYVPFIKSTGGIQTPVAIDFSEKKMYAALDSMVEYINLIAPASGASYPKNYNSCIMGTLVCQYFDTCHKGEENDG